MTTPEPFRLNQHYAPATEPVHRDTADVRAFHRALPDYAETPLVSLPTLATALDLKAVLVKDESSRLGLPAFKMLGASWAVKRALDERTEASAPRLVTATDGNHGRAVARMAKLLDLSATIVIPRGVSEKAIERIRDEGATVQVLDLSYDDTVRCTAEIAEADDSAILIQDTSWPGYEDVPQWIVDGYATMFDEAADQSAAMELNIDLVVVPAGVGSLAHAAVTFGQSRPNCMVVTVEPTVAACISESLAVDELTSVDTGETSMAGLNCGTPAYLAWPELRTGLKGAATVDDSASEKAMAEFAEEGVNSGPCGAASLAALHTMAMGRARVQLGLTSDSVALLLNTEGLASAH